MQTVLIVGYIQDYTWLLSGVNYVGKHYEQQFNPRLVDPSILINWTSPFPILGVSDALFHFYSISNRDSC